MTTDGPAGQALAVRGPEVVFIARAAVIVLAGVATVSMLPLSRLPVAVPIIVAVGCWCAAVALIAGHGQIPAWVLLLDGAVLCLVCATVGWTVPGSDVAGGNDWVSVTVAVSLAAYPWRLRARSATALTLAALVVGLSCFRLVGQVSVQEAFWLGSWGVGVAVLSAGQYILIARAAALVDETSRRVEDQRSRAELSTAQADDEREQLAALHDTAATTLLVIGQGMVTDEPWAAEQAARDLRVLTSGLLPQSAQLPRPDVVELLLRTCATCPLAVETMAEPEPPAVGGGVLTHLPALVAHALNGATREALANVVRHAGVDRARVVMDLAESSVLVEIIDGGRGFTPGTAEGERGGIAGSIMGRMRRAGGWAEVGAGADGGTVVRLGWTPPELDDSPAAPGDDAQALAGAGSAAGLPAHLAAERLSTWLRRSIVGVLWAMILGSFLHAALASPATLGSADVYTVVTMALAAVPTSWFVLTGRDSGWARWPLLTIVVLASVAARVPDAQLVFPQHWTYGIVGWFGVLLLQERGLRQLFGYLTVNSLLILVQVVLAGQGSPHALGTLAVTTCMTVVFQVTGFVCATRLWQDADLARRSVEREERVAAGIRLVRQLEHDRQERAAAILVTTGPLLRALAAGSANPADPAVQRACAVEAARIRRLFAERDDIPDPLAHELQACIEAAERTGVAVGLAVRGARPEMSREVRRALTDPVVHVLAAATGAARVILLGSEHEVSVSVVASVQDPAGLPGPAEPPELPDAAGGEIRVARFTAAHELWVEATWTSPAVSAS